MNVFDVYHYFFGCKFTIILRDDGDCIIFIIRKFIIECSRKSYRVFTILLWENCNY